MARDKAIDCPDGEDEARCDVLKCKNLFQCSKEQTCINLHRIQDGRPECSVTGEDEFAFHLVFIVTNLEYTTKGKGIALHSLCFLMRHVKFSRWTETLISHALLVILNTTFVIFLAILYSGICAMLSELFVLTLIRKERSCLNMQRHGCILLFQIIGFVGLSFALRILV